MHTFKNLVKHKRSSTCFCGTKWGEKKKGENNFQKIYYKCACQVYECQVEFGAKPENSAVKKLKGWPWKVCRQNRVSRPASRLSRYGRITTLFIHFDLSGMHARVLTKDLSSLHLLPVYPVCVSSSAFAAPGAMFAIAVPVRRPLLMSHPNYLPLLVALRETLMKCFILRVSAAY